MSNSRKIIWISLAIFMFIQLGSSYLTNKNQNDLSFLMEMKNYIPYMLYFSLVGITLFLFSFMVYQLDGIKAKKKIAQLEQDKNELKAKLFDMQEAETSAKLLAPKTENPTISSVEKEAIKEETPSSDTDSDSE